MFRKLFSTTNLHQMGIFFPPAPNTHHMLVEITEVTLIHARMNIKVEHACKGNIHLGVHEPKSHFYAYYIYK